MRILTALLAALSFMTDAGAVPGVASITLNPASIQGGSGATSTATVTLSEPAAAGGTVVTLSSSQSGLAASTPRITIPAGATSGTFVVGTNAKYRRESGIAHSAVITATANGVARSATLSVTAQPRPAPFLNSRNGQWSGNVCGGVTPAGGDPGVLYRCARGPNPGTPGLCSFAQECNLGCLTLPADGLTMRAQCGTSGPFPIAVAPNRVLGGEVAIGNAAFAAPAPAFSAEAFLRSDSSAALVVPSAFFALPGGTTSAQVSISTANVTQPRFAEIRIDARLPGTTASRTALAWLAIVPPQTPAPPPAALLAMTLSPTTVQGGSPVTGTVTLDRSAPTGGTHVALSASVLGTVGLQRSVTVPEGSTSASFQITTNTVSADSDVFFQAATQAVFVEAALRVTAAPPAIAQLQSVQVSTPSVVGGRAGQGFVTLNAPAPAGGATVALSSDRPAVANVPSSVIVPAGATSATFPITTAAVTVSTPVSFSGTYAGITRGGFIAVVPLFAGFSIQPTSVTGGTAATATVTLAGSADTGGAVVTLTSDAPSVASVPSSVTVPAGATSASVPVTTFAQGTTSTAVITALHAGVSFLVALTVNSPGGGATLASISVTPASVVGGNTAQGTVTLSAAAPAGGVIVSLASNQAAASVPASVTVPAGASTGAFTVNTTSVASSVAATLTATLASIQRTTTLTITPAPAAVTLTVSATGRNGERVQSTPTGIDVPVGSTGSANFAPGTSITLRATNNRDVIWSGACSSNGAKQRTCTFTLNANANVTGNVQ